MNDMNQHFLNHIVDKGAGVKDGETWHEVGAEKVEGDRLKCRGIKKTTKLSCSSLYLGKKTYIAQTNV